MGQVRVQVKLTNAIDEGRSKGGIWIFLRCGACSLLLWWIPVR
jgi:hypothetical protein